MKVIQADGVHDHILSWLQGCCCTAQVQGWSNKAIQFAELTVSMTLLVFLTGFPVSHLRKQRWHHLECPRAKTDRVALVSHLLPHLFGRLTENII